MGVEKIFKGNLIENNPARKLYNLSRSSNRTQRFKHSSTRLTNCIGEELNHFCTTRFI